VAETNLRRGIDAARAAATAVALGRLGAGRRRRPALVPAPVGDRVVSVVIPARDEAARLGACLEGLRGDRDVGEVIVVDDGSRDATAAIAEDAGARVLTAPALPAGWVGKPWALEQGLRAARGEIVVFLDADTIPRPGLIGALAAALKDVDLVTAGARFRCDTAGERWLHPAMLTTLVYRYGPPDADRPVGPRRLIVNGQCVAVRRRALAEAGGFTAAAGHMTDDAALARSLARRGWRIAFRDGGALLLVDMHGSIAETWREWGRSIGLPDVTSRAARLGDLALVWLVLAGPVLRTLARRGDRLDRALLLVRGAILAATAAGYERRGPAYWLSPLADPVAAVALTRSALRPTRAWRGRVYPAAAGTASRSRS
jgi:dolichol-phosphate mannosyltransferase